MDAVIHGFCYISASSVIHGEDKEEACMDESEEKKWRSNGELWAVGVAHDRGEDEGGDP